MALTREPEDKICDAFDIDPDLLYEKSQRGGSIGDYWKTCFKFFEDVAEKQIKDLSFKQIQWLEKIEDKCVS